MVVRKIISGGQTGADQAGLCVGVQLGLEVGGTAPAEYMTEDGPNPGLLKYTYGLIEGPSGYRERTIRNVKDSDGTVWFGRTTSPGAKLTLGTVKREFKPSIVNPNIEQLKGWIIDCNIQVLNVAGNRASKNPGLSNEVMAVIGLALRE